MDPTDVFFDPDIAPIVSGTFLSKKMQEIHCFPQVRHQKTTSKSGTCSHCCLCPCIEIRNRYHWYEKDSKKWLKYYNAKVDVEFLIDIKPPPTNPLRIVQTLINKHNGHVPKQKKKSKDKTERPFDVKGYEFIHLSKIDNLEENFKLIKHICHQLSTEGPLVVGYLSSRLPTNLKKSETQVYIPEQQCYLYDQSDGMRYKEYHGVCLVGTAFGNYKGKLELFFQILDSNIHSSKNDDGVKFVPWHSLDSILLPKVKKVRKKKVVDEKEKEVVDEKGIVVDDHP